MGPDFLVTPPASPSRAPRSSLAAAFWVGMATTAETRAAGDSGTGLRGARVVALRAILGAVLGVAVRVVLFGFATTRFVALRAVSGAASGFALRAPWAAAFARSRLLFCRFSSSRSFFSSVRSFFSKLRCFFSSFFHSLRSFFVSSFFGDITSPLGRAPIANGGRSGCSNNASLRLGSALVNEVFAKCVPPQFTSAGNFGAGGPFVLAQLEMVQQSNNGPCTRNQLAQSVAAGSSRWRSPMAAFTQSGHSRWI